MTPSEITRLADELSLPWTSVPVKVAWIEVLKPWDLADALRHSAELLKHKQPKDICPADFNTDQSIQDMRTVWAKVEARLAKGERAEVRRIAAQRLNRGQKAVNEIPAHLWLKGDPTALFFAFRDAWERNPPDSASHAHGLGTGRAELEAGPTAHAQAEATAGAGDPDAEYWARHQ